MRAVRQAGFGGREQLSIGQVIRPKAPKGHEVLVRVSAVSVNAGDHHMLTGRPFLIRVAVGRREVPGMDFAGVIEAVGGDVEHLKPGDKVVGSTDVACGAFAEFVSLPSSSVVPKPAKVDWEAAAATPTAGMTALQALRKGPALAKGDSVLINGASGGVGTFAVQLAHLAGAHVTAVCSTMNVELVRSLGADVVVDYRKESVEATAKATGTKFDKIIDCVGRPGWYKLLKPNGSLVAVALPYPDTECIPCALCSVMCSPCCCCCLSSRKSYGLLQEVKAADLEELLGMQSEGKLRAAVGCRLVGIDQLPDALAGHSATTGLGHCTGKTVVSFADGSTIAVPENEDMHRM